MSRIDEAMRRAWAEGDGTSMDKHAKADLPGIPAEGQEPTRDPFPLELPQPGHRSTSMAANVASFPHLAPVPPSVSAPRAVSKIESLMNRIDGSVAKKIVIDQSTDAASREQYRRLAATLHHSQAARGLKVLIVSSALPGEGKTLTASNLALTFSESYQRSVLLIDGDLRRPALHSIFHIDNSSGLSDGLAAIEQRPLPARQFSARLAILPAGRETADPTSGLTSERMGMLVSEARSAFDWVIIDTPPVAVLADANLLTAMADGVVLVIKAGSTPLDFVKRAIEVLGRDRVLGVVLNRVEQSPSAARYEYYDSYPMSSGDGGSQS